MRLRVRRRWAHPSSHRPVEPVNEVGRDRDRNDLRLLRETPDGRSADGGDVAPSTLARLHRERLPRIRRRLTDRHFDRWAMMITPCGLHEHMATVTASRFGDRALAARDRCSNFSRDTRPRYARQLRRAVEPPPIDDLGNQHHRGLERDPAETLRRRCTIRRERRTARRRRS